MGRFKKYQFISWYAQVFQKTGGSVFGFLTALEFYQLIRSLISLMKASPGATLKSIKMYQLYSVLSGGNLPVSYL